MALSRPLYNVLGFYFEKLHSSPLITKSITSAILSLGANYISQRLSADKNAEVDTNSLFAYGLFGLLFGGTVPHYFYGFIEKITKDVKNRKMFQFILQRILFTPCYAAISLFFLAIFEGSSSQGAYMNMMKLYKSVLIANWKYLTLPVYINFKYVHPMLRVLVTNFIGVFWTIYLANKRRLAKRKASEDPRKPRK